MKKIFYLSMILAFIGSFAVARGTTVAARSNAAMITVRLCSSAPVGVGGDAHIVQGIWHGVSAATATWRGKFKKVPGAGQDLQLDGADLLQEAREEKLALKEELASRVIGAPTFQWG